MAIRLTKYINIISGVGAGAVVANRDLIGRLFTTNELLPSNSLIEFDTLTDVGNYFGTTSDEYKRAVFYFGWISKNITSPQKISYARWVNADQPPMIFGGVIPISLTALKLITNGSFSLTMGTDTHVISGLDFSGAANLAAVAALIQVAIRLQTGTQWTAATVTYNAVRSSFDLVGGSAVVAAVSVAAGNIGTNIATDIGWLPESVNGTPGAIWSDGELAESTTAVLTASAQASNNFGSFLFMQTLDLAQIIEAAAWNTAQNVLYQYEVPVSNLTDATTYSAALINYAGVAITLAPLATEYPEQVPMMILAATNYDKQNSTQNYMFQQFALTPSVTTDSFSDAYDAIRVNYYGQTQTAGQLIQFYQRGVLTGLATNPIDMNTYANEQWLKDAMGAALMTLLLALAKVSANAQGRAQIITTMQSVVNQALANGTISVQGVLSTVQKLYIEQVTNDPLAWYQVQTIGYWLDCVIQAVIKNGITEYEAVYTLVYKKDDIVRSVQGTHVLI